MNKEIITKKDLRTEQPRWCAACGDFGILQGLMKIIVDCGLDPAETVNVSGIGCSGRTPYYIDTYGIHALHGRPITVALGLRLANPKLNIFIESGDGDALSIGISHLIHGINRNFNCVFLLYDNGLYALTKSQTSPTTRQGHKTQTNPEGTFLAPLNPPSIALGAGCSFVAVTADWLNDHLLNTIKLAFKHDGFSFVHILQRCPYFDPDAFSSKTTDWFVFLEHPKGVPADKRLAEKCERVRNNPGDRAAAIKRALDNKTYFGLLYRDADRPCYDKLVRRQTKHGKVVDDSLFEPFLL
jgi:2-oxoglutarate/2-oxoacid ferredoxin oxidoreductase subunit beta